MDYECQKKYPEGIAFQEMIEELHQIFEDDNVNVEQVNALLTAYRSDPADWKKFTYFDPHRYTRNLVDAGNGKFNLMTLCWGEGMASSIHDHANAHCFVKMLQGTLKETQYHWPDKDANDEPLKEKCATYADKDQVCYINDEIGLHRMENPSHTEPAVSLHVYIPAFRECRTFDERTGRTRAVAVTFWSEMGRRTKCGQNLGMTAPIKKGNGPPMRRNKVGVSLDAEKKSGGSIDGIQQGHSRKPRDRKISLI